MTITPPQPPPPLTPVESPEGSGTVATTGRNGKGRALKIVLMSLLGLLALVTIYLGVVTFLWGQHVSEAKEARAAIEDQLKQERATLTGLVGDHYQFSELLRFAKRDLVALANDKAAAQDYQDMYSNVSFALADCATEQGEHVAYVKRRQVYPLYVYYRYRDSVNDYCESARAQASELIAEEAEELE